ncbi:MAG: adenosylmethionine decarboxylase, partial [Thermoprotei archaeon]
MKRVGVGLGKHIIAELFECDSDILDNVNVIKESLLEAATTSNSAVINYSFHRFKPYGVSGYVLIAESHISIHTWPEYGYAAVDVFTCGDKTNPWKGLE